jgi:hypothetical protein
MDKWTLEEEFHFIVYSLQNITASDWAHLRWLRCLRGTGQERRREIQSFQGNFSGVAAVGPTYSLGLN